MTIRNKIYFKSRKLSEKDIPENSNIKEAIFEENKKFESSDNNCNYDSTKTDNERELYTNKEDNNHESNDLLSESDSKNFDLGSIDKIEQILALIKNVDLLNKNNKMDSNLRRKLFTFLSTVFENIYSIDTINPHDSEDRDNSFALIKNKLDNMLHNFKYFYN